MVIINNKIKLDLAIEKDLKIELKINKASKLYEILDLNNGLYPF
jgi:hypothetical protein